MNYKEQLEQYKTELEKVNNSYSNLFDTQAEIEAKILQLKIDEILKADLLAEGLWQITKYGNIISNTFFFPTLVKLLRPDNHCCFKLSKDIFLYFNDNEMSITINDNDQIEPIIKKYKLRITADKLDERIESLEEDINKLKELKRFATI